MRPTLAWYWERLSTSYWFVPTLMACAALGLAVGLGALDERMSAEVVAETAWLWNGGPEGARTLLGAVATAMITVASTVFSITTVALTLASNQFGPRLLRGFMRDRGNQLVLGTFLATFVYCLLVLRSVRGDAASPFVPHVSISVAIVLALVNVGVLIYFIHHVSVSIHVDEVIAAAGRDLDLAIASLCPPPPQPRPSPADALPEAGGAPLRADCSGYLQVFDEDAALAVLVAHDAVLRVALDPSRFVLRGGELGRVWPAEALPRVADALRETFVISAQRTPMQDLAFALDEMVEIAVRALSPGINDPFTAATCVDWLCDALARLADRELPSGRRHDALDRLRLVRPTLTLAAAVDLAFDAIRRNATGAVSVALRQMEAIRALCDRIADAPARAALGRHADLIEAASREWRDPHARERLLAQHRAIRAALAGEAAPA